MRSGHVPCNACRFRRGEHSRRPIVATSAPPIPTTSALIAMPRVLFTDQDYPDVELERGLFHAAGIELVAVNHKTEDELIAAGKEFDAFLIQYAPITDRVLSALPRLGIV